MESFEPKWKSYFETNSSMSMSHGLKYYGKEILKYLYNQTKEQAKTIELLTERMTKQDELIQEQSKNLEQYINGEEVILLKKGVFKPK